MSQRERPQAGVRLGPNDRFWLVTNPTPESEESDILYETTLAGLERQFRGGLTAAENPTIFTDEGAARVEAFGRMVAMRAARAIAREAAEGRPVARAERIEVLDADGNVLFEADL